MKTVHDYNARLRGDDLLEYYQYLCRQRIDNPQDNEIKDTIAELQGLVLTSELNGNLIIDLREKCLEAEKFIGSGNPEEALTLLQEVIEVHSEHYFAIYLLGVLALNKGDYAAARGCFLQAFENNQYFIDAVLRIFDCSVYLGDINFVQEFLLRALELQPEDLELLEVKNHLENGTYPERISKHLKSKNKIGIREELRLAEEALKNGDMETASFKIAELKAMFDE